MRSGVSRLDELIKDILPVDAVKPALNGPGVEFCMCRMNGKMLRKSVQFLEYDASNALDCDLELIYLQKGCIDVGFNVRVEDEADFERIHAAFHEGLYDALIAKHEIFRVNFINWPQRTGTPANETLAFELED